MRHVCTSFRASCAESSFNEYSGSGETGLGPVCRARHEAMQEKYRDKPGLKYLQMDGRALEFPEA